MANNKNNNWCINSSRNKSSSDSCTGGRSYRMIKVFESNIYWNTVQNESLNGLDYNNNSLNIDNNDRPSANAQRGKVLLLLLIIMIIPRPCKRTEKT